MPVTIEQLWKIMPHAESKAAAFLPFLNAAMTEFDISTPARVEMFLATVAHESGDLQSLVENLNYSAVGLCKTWPSRFPTLEAALPFNRNPEKIANKVYASRGGNGDEASGDGWRHRGAGLIQLTFKSNQAACAEHFKKRIEDMPAWLQTIEGACRSAAWFWKTHGCNDYADRGDFDGVCDIVNLGRKTTKEGDAIGFPARLAVLDVAQRVIA